MGDLGNLYADSDGLSLSLSLSLPVYVRVFVSARTVRMIVCLLPRSLSLSIPLFSLTSALCVRMCGSL